MFLGFFYFRVRIVGFVCKFCCVFIVCRVWGVRCCLVFIGFFVYGGRRIVWNSIVRCWYRGCEYYWFYFRKGGLDFIS